jgi:hypothetical protein
MKTTKLPRHVLAKRRRRKKILLAQSEELRRKAIIRLVEEAELMIMALEQDDLAAGDYPHLARAIKDVKEWI